jgi:hypothetical protein
MICRNIPYRHPTGPTRRFAIAALGLCGALVAAVDPAEAKPDWTPGAAIAVPDGEPLGDHHDYDRSFNGTGYYRDRFAGSSGNDYLGRKITRLEDGSYVTAGIVPRPGQSTPTQVGLVHYSASGVRLTWDSVNPAYGEFGNQYIVYPQGNGGQPTGNFTDIARIEAYDGNLYVLANETDGNYVHPIMLTFTYEGFFRGWATYFPGGDARKPGVDFTIDKGVKTITVLGSDPNNGSYNQLWMSRYVINADGSPGGDSSFPFTFFNLDSSFCGSAAIAGHCPLRPAAITTAGTRLVFPPLAAGFYVAATRTYSTAGDTDPCIIAFNANGGVRTGFSDDGVRCVSFDDGGNLADRAVAIARSTAYTVAGVVQDRVYLAASVARETLPGIGVAKLDGSGSLDAAFHSGSIVFGGCGSGQGNCNFINVENTPLAMARQDGRLGIVGWYRGYNDAAHTDIRFNYPLFALLDADDATVRNFDAYDVSGDDATFFDVVGDGGGRFAMAGDARVLSEGNKLTYFTARLQPDDAIFHDGFD